MVQVSDVDLCVYKIAVSRLSLPKNHLLLGSDSVVHLFNNEMPEVTRNGLHELTNKQPLPGRAEESA